jgi:hypothetical protein
MLTRCRNSATPVYQNYGGRGITCDPQWEDFENFLADMGERPSGTSLDRIDVDGPYCRENCRWATIVQQQNNKRNNHILEYAGLSYTVAQWSSITGFTRQTITSRLSRGLPVHEALTRPVKAKDGFRYSAIQSIASKGGT